MEHKNNLSGPYESYKTSLIYKDWLNSKKKHLEISDDDIKRISDDESEKEDSKKNEQKKIKKAKN